MIKEFGVFTVKLLLFSMLLFGVHYYILGQFFSGHLTLPLWAIYSLNAFMVLGVYLAVRYYSHEKPQNALKTFLIFSGIKMVLVLVFLLPIFLKKSAHPQLEIFNFFIPYFIFLIFEISGLNKFLQKT